MEPLKAITGIQLDSSELEHRYQQCDCPMATLRDRPSKTNIPIKRDRT
ncbi:hypothetical protein [Moorena sp. SIO3I8]|nr:hypothetical protein [Moorena sp. SIO3I8]NEO08763.1 hypothetical protein [Moorena sp. SIO3I8]